MDEVKIREHMVEIKKRAKETDEARLKALEELRKLKTKQNK
jgi:hypothetical protein